MKLRRRHLLAAGLLAYAGTLLATLPAGLLREPLAGQLPALQLGPLSGSAFAGAAAPLAWQGLRLDAAQWRWRPAALLLGRLGADLELRAGPSHLALRAGHQLGFGTTRLEGVDGDLDLDWLSSGLRGLPGRLRGRLGLDAVNLQLDAAGWPGDASGAYLLRGLEVTAPVRLALGDFSGTLASEGEQLRIAFATTAGNPLDGQGTLLLSAEGGYRLSARLAARDPNDAGASGLLQLAGRPGPDGRVTLERNGRWR